MHKKSADTVPRHELMQSVWKQNPIVNQTQVIYPVQPQVSVHQHTVCNFRVSQEQLERLQKRSKHNSQLINNRNSKIFLGKNRKDSK